MAKWIKCLKCKAETPLSDEDDSEEMNERCDNCGFRLDEKDISWDEDFRDEDE